MATKSSRLAGGQDRISDLPDELLETILNYLRSAAAAARTSVLSRRWRFTWTRIPDLIFLNDVSSADAVDAAIAVYSVPAMNKFFVGLINMPRPVAAARAAAWLRFAAARVPRVVNLILPPKNLLALLNYNVEEDLEVPLLETTDYFNVYLMYHFRLRLPSADAGAFGNLSILRITGCRVSGADLSRLVSEQCPSLSVLDLSSLETDGDLSIRSDTLEQLKLAVVGDNHRLEVAAPSLELLLVSGCNPADARITAPKLTDLEWDDFYDPSLHIVHGTGRRLHRLAVNQWRWDQVPLLLLQRFDEVGELSIHLSIDTDPPAYSMFVESTSKLPKSKVLTVGINIWGHAFGSSLLHLLRNCGDITKLKIELFQNDKVSLCKEYGCPCVQPEALRTDNVALKCLEHVEFHFFTGSDDDLALVNTLLMCKKTIKRMVIKVADGVSLSEEEVCEKIRRFAHPSTVLEIGREPVRNTCQCKEHHRRY